jgi:hypothetical protein
MGGVVFVSLRFGKTCILSLIRNSFLGPGTIASCGMPQHVTDLQNKNNLKHVFGWQQLTRSFAQELFLRSS